MPEVVLRSANRPDRAQGKLLMSRMSLQREMKLFPGAPEVVPGSTHRLVRSLWTTVDTQGHRGECLMLKVLRRRRKWQLPLPSAPEVVLKSAHQLV